MNPSTVGGLGFAMAYKKLFPLLAVGTITIGSILAILFCSKMIKKRSNVNKL